MHSTKFDIIIIGSGLSGLLCGYILSREGFHVGILEKNNQPGGNLQTFARRGNRFETGVHYIGGLDEGQTLWRYWKYFGLTDRIPRTRLDPYCFDKIAFNEYEYSLAQGADNFIEMLAPLFTNGEAELKRYLNTIGEIASKAPLYNLDVPQGRYVNDFASRSAREFFQSFESRPITPANLPVTLGAVLSGNNFLYGGESATPLSVAAIINHSYISGTYRVNGGSDLVARELIRLIELSGGKIITGTEIIKISQHHDTFRVVSSSNHVYDAKIVISSAHPAVTLSMLPNEMIRPVYRKRITSLKNSVSSFILYLSLKPGKFPCLKHNYYFHSGANLWDESGASGKSWPKMYLLTTGCRENGSEYADTVTIMTYMRYDEVLRWHDTSLGRRGEGYLRFKYERADILLHLVKQRFPALSEAVENMEVSTPLTYRDYTGIPEGSLYGIARDFSNPLQIAVPPKTKIPNFYFTGQNSNLHGVVGVTISAVMTCGEILGLDYLLSKIKNA